MLKRMLLAALAVSALPLCAQAADGLSYTWVEGDYVNLDRAGDGVQLRGSANIGDTGFYALGSLGRTDGGNASNDHVRSDELGVGFHHSVASKTDLIGEVAYRNAHAGGTNIDGARGSVGVRSELGDRFEGFVKANYYDASDYQGDVTGTLGGQFKVNKTWGATAEAEVGKGEPTYLLGVRASF